MKVRTKMVMLMMIESKVVWLYSVTKANYLLVKR